jgi:hypothetical protein
LVVISQPIESGILVSLIMCFATLGPSTSNSFYATSPLDMSFEILAYHCLGDGPPLILPSFVMDYLSYLFNVIYCDETLTITL